MKSSKSSTRSPEVLAELINPQYPRHRQIERTTPKDSEQLLQIVLLLLEDGDFSLAYNYAKPPRPWSFPGFRRRIFGRQCRLIACGSKAADDEPPVASFKQTGATCSLQIEPSFRKSG